MLIITNNLSSVIEIVIDGEVTEEDIKEFEDYFRQKKEKDRKMNVLMEIKDLNYTLDGLMKEIKFDTKYIDDFEKVAVVSDRKWMEVGEKLAQYMPKVEVKQFDPEEKEKAMAWVS